MEFVHGRQTNHFGTLASLWRKWINNQASTERCQQKLGTANHWRLWLCPYGRNLLGGRSWGVLLALDEHSGFPFYLAFIENETASDYEKAIRSIEERGYTIFGIIIDGKKSLFTLFSDYQIQMCQFHMKQVIRRYLTQNPRLKAARELKGLLDTLTVSSGRDFKINYAQWKEKWKDTLEKRSLLKCGKKLYSQALAFCDTQLGFLYAIPLYVSKRKLWRHAKYEQQDRGNFYQSEEKAERT